MESLSEEECNQLEATSVAVKQRRHGAAKLEHRHRAQSIIQSKALDELETEVLETGLYENVDLGRGSRGSVVAAEIMYSCLWWIITNALAPQIWFYPLCALEISGYEVICILWFSPLLMLISPIQRGASSPLGLLLLRLLTLMGMASYQAPTSLSRLIVLGIGNMFAMLALSATWWNMSKLDRHRHIYLHMLGYLLMLAVRVWFTSFDPVFMSFTYNNIATALGIVLATFLYCNDCRTPIVPEGSKELNRVNSSKELNSEKLSKPLLGTARGPGLVVTAVGFGALLFLTQLLFGDVSVVSRWAVACYPNRGPYPYPWSFATMLKLTVGLVMFGHQRDLLGSPAWLFLGFCSAMVLYFMQSYFAFFGGLILAVYTMSLWPHLLKRLTAFPVGKALPVAYLTLILLTVLSVWVVAYNFVPGGTITRERTDVLLAITVLLIGFASRNVGSSGAQLKDKENLEGKHDKATSKKGSKRVSYVGHVFRRLSTITEEVNEQEWVAGLVHKARSREVYAEEEKEYHRFHGKVVQAAMFIFLLATLGLAYRYQPPLPMPEKEHPRMFSAGIWAFHFGYDNDAYPSMERAAQLINNTGVDVIGLLETDASRPYIGNHDIASWLAERLHMHVDYGPGTKDHTWGALVLSKYPIVKSQHYLLPSPEGELAPALLVTVNISGVTVDFYCVHFGNDVDELDRKLQAEKSSEILSSTPNPVIMLSYITNPPGSRDYLKITNSGRVKDIEPGDRYRWCEYIFYRGVIRLGYARVSHGGLSDTEVQIGKFRIPDYPDEPDNGVLTQSPSEVPDWTHFPSVFGSLYHGHFADQSRHHFHMGTPKYFKSS